MFHTATWKFQHRITCIILQVFVFVFFNTIIRVRKSNKVGNKLEDSWLMLIKRNYTNKYSLHFSHLISPPLNQSSRVTSTINLDDNSYIISKNLILLGKAVIVKKNKPSLFFFLIFFSTIVFFLFIYEANPSWGYCFFIIYFFLVSSGLFMVGHKS